MFKILIAALVAYVAADVTCKTPGGAAPCIMEMPGLHACPDGFGCIVDKTDDSKSICCDLNEIVNAQCPAATVAPPTTSPCMDKVNPNTGVSDCPRLAYLCNDPGYYALMTDQCPKTCNRCSNGVLTTGTPPTCQDKANPTTGVSECAQNVALCHNPIYEPLMMDQCPKTCGFC